MEFQRINFEFKKIEYSLSPTVPTENIPGHVVNKLSKATPLNVERVQEFEEKLSFEDHSSLFERNFLYKKSFDPKTQEDFIAARENYFSPALDWVKISDHHWVEGVRAKVVDFKLNVSSAVIPDVTKVFNLHANPEISDLFSSRVHFSIFEDCVWFILDLRLEAVTADIFVSLEATHCYNLLIENALNLPLFLVPVFCYTLKANAENNPLYCVNMVQQYLRNRVRTLLSFDLNKEVLHHVIKKSFDFNCYGDFFASYPKLKESIKSSIEDHIKSSSIRATFKANLNDITESTIPKRRTHLKVKVGAATGLGVLYSGFWLYQNYGTQVYNGDKVNIFQGPRGRSVAKTTQLVVKSVGSLSVCVAGSIDAFISPFKKVFLKNLDIFSSPFKKFVKIVVSTAKDSTEIVGSVLKDASEDGK